MSDDEGLKKAAKNVGKTGDGIVKGIKAYNVAQGKNYQIKFDTSRSCLVNVLNKVGKAGKMEPIFRLDKAHHGAEFNHINLNPKYSGITKQVTTPSGKVKTVPHDPHIKLPPGTLAVGQGTAKICQVMNQANKVLVPLAIAIDTFRVGYAGHTDYKNGTSRNVVETTASVAGGWAGGYGGAVGGAAIGSAICPGIGTIIGGIIGGLSGGITGSVASGVVVDAIGDAVDYDIVEINCDSCGKRFKARKYRGEKYCERCLNKLRLKPI